jgi:hypothetical protein
MIDKYPVITLIGLNFLCINLSACQQVLDRLESDFKASKVFSEPLVQTEIRLLKLPPEPASDISNVETINSLPVTKFSNDVPEASPPKTASTKLGFNKHSTEPSKSIQSGKPKISIQAGKQYTFSGNRNNGNEVQTVDEDGNRLLPSLGMQKPIQQPTFIVD